MTGSIDPDAENPWENVAFHANTSNSNNNNNNNNTNNNNGNNTNDTSFAAFSLDEASGMNPLEGLGSNNNNIKHNNLYHSEDEGFPLPNQNDINTNTNHMNAITNRRMRRLSPFQSSILRILSQAFLGADFITGLILSIYTCLLVFQSPASSSENDGNSTTTTTTAPHTVTAVLGCMAALYLGRCLLGSLALSSSMCRRCGLYVSAITSILLAAVFALISPMTLIWKAHLQSYLTDHYDALHRVAPLWTTWMMQQDGSHWNWIWLIFLIMALLEVARYKLLSYYRGHLVQWDDDMEDYFNGDLRRPLMSTAERNGIPSWVNAFETGTTYSYYTEEPPTSPPRQQRRTTSPTSKTSASWLWFLGDNNNNNDTGNVRDDGSVDFASVQEEWASRSSEDPYWWSRDERHPQQQQRHHDTMHGVADTKAADLSWTTAAEDDQRL